METEEIIIVDTNCCYDEILFSFVLSFLWFFFLFVFILLSIVEL